MNEENIETHQSGSKKQPTELEVAQDTYEKALDRVSRDPSLDNLRALELAERHLYEIEDLYREGAKLLLVKTIDEV